MRNPASNSANNIDKISMVAGIASVIIGILGLVIAWYAIRVPLKENQNILEKQQASQIHAYIVDASLQCDGSAIQNEQLGWRVCLKNPSDAPIYEIEFNFDSGANINNEITGNHEVKKFVGIAIFQLLPGQSQEINFIPKSESVSFSNENGNSSTSSSNINSINLQLEFKDNSNIKWKTTYSFSDLDKSQSEAKFTVGELIKTE